MVMTGWLEGDETGGFIIGDNLTTAGCWSFFLNGGGNGGGGAAVLVPRVWSLVDKPKYLRQLINEYKCVKERRKMKNTKKPIERRFHLRKSFGHAWTFLWFWTTLVYSGKLLTQRQRVHQWDNWWADETETTKRYRILQRTGTKRWKEKEKNRSIV